MVLTPTYYVFDLYQGHMDARQLDCFVEAENAGAGAYSLAGVTASASEKDGKITLTLSNLNADIDKCIKTARANGIMNGFTDADWDKLQSDLSAYKLDEFLGIFQKYVDASPDAALCVD